MLQITKDLKNKIPLLDSVEERISLIKDSYKGKTAVIVLTGPTLKDHNHGEMRDIFENREDIVVISVKQAYTTTLNTTDFHVLNPWNIDRKTPTKYKDDNPIVFWNVAQSYQDAHLNIIAGNNHPCDMWVPCLNPPYITDRDTIQATCDFDKWGDLGEKTQLYWGKSILYSTIFPLVLHLGCKDIVTIGWDFKSSNTLKEKSEHFYDNNKKIDEFNSKDDIEMIESTSKLYDWCLKNNITIKILSDVNPCEKKFTRIKSINDI
jgi:hypothetical protein